MVGRGSAYDLFLTRELKTARAGLRAPTSPAVVDEFLKQRADVAAGVRQQLQADAARLGGVRLLPGRFMVIEQAMGVPAARGDARGAGARRLSSSRPRRAAWSPRRCSATASRARWSRRRRARDAGLDPALTFAART